MYIEWDDIFVLRFNYPPNKIETNCRGGGTLSKMERRRGIHPGSTLDMDFASPTFIFF